MKGLKIFISTICIFALLVCGTGTVVAEDSLDNREYAPRVESQRDEEDCLYYAILSTAGSYAKKYFNASDGEADFNESSLKKTVGATDIHNFADTLYKSIGCNIGNGYAITSVSFIPADSKTQMKKEIKSNGAVVAAITVPQYLGLENETFYNSENNTFNYYGGKSRSFHAVSIVGWDDGNAVWICKNSYGADFGEDGYFYLSYKSPIIFAASIEVSQLKGLLTVKKATGVRETGYIYGINVKAYTNSTANVIVKIREKEVFSKEDVELKNGCNLIMFDSPVRSGKVIVEVDGISTPLDTVYCYTSASARSKMNVKHAVADDGAVTTTEIKELTVYVKSGQACAFDDNYVNHKIRKNSTDSCYYITPNDGYEFSENIKVNIEGNGELKSIDTTEIVIHSGEIGNAYVKNVNILIDEKGEIRNTLLTFDDGSVIPCDATVTLYKDSDRTEQIESISGLKEYFAEIEINYSGEKEYTVSVNGVVAGTESGDKSEKISFYIKIVVPDITMSGWDSLKDTFVDVSNAWTNVGDNLRRFLKALFRIK